MINSPYRSARRRALDRRRLVATISVSNTAIARAHWLGSSSEGVPRRDAGKRHRGQKLELHFDSARPPIAGIDRCDVALEQTGG
jgi:hypothetical protein